MSRHLRSSTRFTPHLVLSLLVLLAASCTQQRLQRGTIVGTVSENGVGIAGATVQIRDQRDPNAAQSAITDSEGLYSFTNVLPSFYTVSATAPGYDCEGPKTREVDVTGDGTRALQVADFACTRPPARIDVTVSSQGAPVSGATVTLEGPSPSSLPTDANGTASFLNRVPGSYTVRVAYQGHTCQQRAVEADPNETVAVAIDCAPLPASIVVSVQSGSAPVSGATVTATRAGQAPITGTTGTNGTVTLSVPHGSYTITAQAPGLNCGTGTANPGPGETTNTSIACGPATATIVVTVRNGATTAPIPDATVSLGGTTPGSGLTDANGRITFSGLAPGTYTITVVVIGFNCGGANPSVGPGATLTLTINCTATP